MGGIATTEVRIRAQVEQVRPGEWRVRCGNPKCPSRSVGRPLQGPSTIAQIRGSTPFKQEFRCVRCGAYNEVEITEFDIHQ